MVRAIVIRIFRLIESPRATWKEIEEEEASAKEIQNNFFYPLVIIVALATFLGALINGKPIEYMLKETVVVLTSTVAGYFIAVILLNEIISRLFDVENSYAACAGIIAYSIAFKLCVDVIVAIVPSLFILYLSNFYVAYIIWEGAGIMFRELKENKRGFFTVICFILLYVSPFLIKRGMYLMMK